MGLINHSIYLLLSKGAADFDPSLETEIILTMNDSIACMNVNAVSDGIHEVVEETVQLRLVNIGNTSVMITVPTLTLSIEPSPPLIMVPSTVNASKGNAAVVCFTALLPPNGGAGIRLAPFNNNASKSDQKNKTVSPANHG